MEVNITMPCWRVSGEKAPETEAGRGWREAEAEPVHLGRDVRANSGFSNAKV
jgi:hypothetical protein